MKAVDDNGIVALYLLRDEAAIRQTAEKYGGRLRALAYGIVRDPQTAEECENDAYLEAWRSIPPHEPRDYLYAFLARITRHISLNRCRDRGRLKPPLAGGLRSALFFPTCKHGEWLRLHVCPWAILPPPMWTVRPSPYGGRLPSDQQAMTVGSTVCPPCAGMTTQRQSGGVNAPPFEARFNDSRFLPLWTR